MSRVTSVVRAPLLPVVCCAFRVDKSKSGSLFLKVCFFFSFFFFFLGGVGGVAYFDNYVHVLPAWELHRDRSSAKTERFKLFFRVMCVPYEQNALKLKYFSIYMCPFYSLCVQLKSSG